MNRWTVVALLCIVAVAAWLRLGHIDLIHFGTDQATAAFMAVDMARGGHFAQTGNSDLRFNPPGFIWILSVAAVFSTHPLALTAYIGLLGVIAVLVVFFLGRVLRDDMTGLAAAGLLAVSPWAVQYSRTLWPNNVLPLLTSAAALTLVLALRRGSGRMLVASIVLVALAMQAHASVAAFALAWGAALALGFKPTLLRGLLVGIAAGVVLWLPFLAYQIAHPAAPRPWGRPDALPGDSLANVVGLLGWPGFAEYFLGPEQGRVFQSEFLAVAIPMGWMLAVAVGLGCFTMRKDHRSETVLVLGWLLLPLVGLLASGLPILPQYFIVTLPAQALLAGCAMAAIGRTQFVMAVILIVVAVHTVAFNQLNRRLAQPEVRPSGDFRASYRFIHSQVQGARGNAELEGRLRKFEWARYLLDHAP